MKKTKRWKLEGCYYGSDTKFDRNYIKNYEGMHMPIHRFRDRRNWQGPYAWVPYKYTKGLLLKYINKPIEALEQAFNARVKDIKNHATFRQAYSYIIYGFSERSNYRGIKAYKYIIENGILRINSEYKSYKSYKCPKLKSHQNIYNLKHIKNPGIVRTYPIGGPLYSANSYMKTRKPIYLGKLYVRFSDGAHLVDVYHYYRDFPAWKVDKDPNIKKKFDNFSIEWVNVDIGIKRLDALVEEPNKKYYDLQKIIQNPDSTEEEILLAKKSFKHTRPTVVKNYGIGEFLNPVCRRKDIEKICSRN